MFGQYNPYLGATPQMQQRLANLQQQQFYQQQPLMNTGYVQPTILKGRPVTNLEEAKAAQIDLDGSSTFFPCLADGKIYEKSIDLNGVPVFKVYELVKQQEKKKADYVEVSVVNALQQRIEQLEKIVAQFKKGGVRNESIPVNANVAVNQQPNGTYAANGRQQSGVQQSYANGTGEESPATTGSSQEPSTPAWYE